MKHFNRSHLAIVPLLSILAMSPSVMESTYSYRSIASVEVENEPVKKDAPVRYEALVSKIKPESLLKNENPELEKIKESGEKLHQDLSQTREEFKKDLSDKKLVAEQRTKIEELVIKSHLLKLDIDQLQSKQASESDEVKQEKTCLEESIMTIEGLLADLEANEALVAAADSQPAEDEPKKEEIPAVADKPATTEEPKKSDLLCELEEQNKVLTTKLEKLVEDQSKIMQTVLGMAQMMVSMFQQQQQTQMPNPYYANGPGFQNPYQYQQPTTAGNWVYYPSGFQPGQNNIFAQGPQQFQQYQPQQPQGGFYPDQVHQSNWNLQPQMNFAPDPRYNVQNIPMGTFGSTPFSYDLTNNVPTVSQL